MIAPPYVPDDIHRGQQDQRRLDSHLVGERQREHDTHHERQARQHRDQHAKHQADHDDRKVERREDVGQAVQQIDEHVHRSSEVKRRSVAATAPTAAGTDPRREAARCKHAHENHQQHESADHADQHHRRRTAVAADPREQREEKRRTR